MSATTAPPSTPPGGAQLNQRSPQGPSGPSLRGWLVGRRNEGATPAVIASELVGGGWDADAAARAALSSLRSSDRRGGLYAALTATCGLAALAFATAAHLVLAGNVDPAATASALTVAVVLVPLAAWCAVLASRVERTSRFVVWSPERRFWFGALAGCTAAVGVVRALAYTYAVIAGYTGAAAQPSGADLAQVAVTLGVALPLFVWSFTQWRSSNVVLTALGDPTPTTDRGRRGQRTVSGWRATVCSARSAR